MIVDPDQAILNLRGTMHSRKHSQSSNNKGLKRDFDDISNSNKTPNSASAPAQSVYCSVKDAGKVSSNLAIDRYQSMLAMGTSTGIIKIFSLKGYEQEIYDAHDYEILN